MYTDESDSYYPYRHLAFPGIKPLHIKFNTAGSPLYDWRPRLREVFDIDTIGQCPLPLQLGLDAASTTYVESSYAYYAPWTFNGHDGRLRIDEPFYYNGVPFRVVASDFEIHRVGSFRELSHPSIGGKSVSATTGVTVARYGGPYTTVPVQMNYAFDDGSVRGNHSFSGDGMIRVPYSNNPGTNPTFDAYIPTN